MPLRKRSIFVLAGALSWSLLAPLSLVVAASDSMPAATQLERAAGAANPGSLKALSDKIAPAAPAPGRSGLAALSNDAARVEALNSAIAKLLRPLNDNLTRAFFIFKAITVNERRTTRLSFIVDFFKRGTRGDLALNVKDFSYSFPETASAKPELKADIFAELDLLSLLPQEQINQLGPAADQLAKEWLRDYGSEYGDAVRLDARITRKETDARGNLTAIGLSLEAAIDLGKLPQGRDERDVLFTSLRLDASATLKGIDLSVRVTSNPKSKYFDADEAGLKEMLEKLLSQDPETVSTVKDFMNRINEFASAITSGRAFGRAF